MRARVITHVVAVAVLLGVWLGVAQPALAGYENIGGGLPYTGVWIMYSYQRNVSYSPWGIAFKGYAGPSNWQISHFQCVNPSNTSIYEPEVLYDTWVYTRPNDANPYPIGFCLRAKKNAGIQTSFNGDLSWDG